MSLQPDNIDTGEQSKFDALASDWWKPDGNLRTLHDINPLRMEYINRRTSLAGKAVLDVGCGGGLLCEALAAKGADVTGIDISSISISIARSHSQVGNYKINYEHISPETLARSSHQKFDVITCMEMLEHVPDPESIISACATMVKPGGDLFFSTINRTPSAYLMAILAAEYLLKLLPRGTHEYARFIHPSELAAWCQIHGLTVEDITGMSYIPLLRKAIFKKTPDVNYLMHARYG